MDNSQVSDKAAGSANGAGGFERTAFQDAFSSSPREARQRKTGRFFKTLENISFCQTSAGLTRDSRPRAKPGLIRLLCKQTFAARSPSHEADALARAAAFSSFRITTLAPPHNAPTFPCPEGDTF